MQDRDKKPAQDDHSGAGAAGAENKVDPRIAAGQKKVRAAVKHNRAHPDLVSEFNELTEGVAAKGIRAIMSWQKSHGVAPADGKVGPNTLAAAKAKGGTQEGEGAEAAQGVPGHDTSGDKKKSGHKVEPQAKAASHVEFSDEEAEEVTAGDAFEGEGIADDGPKLENPETPAERAVQGATPGLEHRTANGEKEADEDHERLGAAGPDTIEKGGLGFDAGEAGGGKATAVKGAAFLTRIPHLCDLIRDKKYGEAVRYATSAVGWEDRAELMKFAIEKLAGEVAPKLAGYLEKAVVCGAVADVLLIGWEWVQKGFEAIHEAHEKGDQDSRIGIYAFAWSDVVMNGTHSNPGAVTSEQREAKELGIRDGLATRDQNPGLPELLLAEYGNKLNARRALQDAAFRDAGIDVKNHHE